MRCLVVADLHYALQQYDWVVAVAPEFDVVIIAGDHLDTSSLVDCRAQSIVIQKYIHRLHQKTKLVVCSGNHDLDSHDTAGEKVAQWILRPRAHGIASDGDSVVHGDTLFTICPWWDGPAARDRLALQLAADAKRRAKRWIWVHHAPPSDSPVSWGGTRYYGDVALSQWIAEYRPDIVFSGHVHQSPFTDSGSWADKVGSTWVFNMGHQFGAPPAHIIFDSVEETALWFSAAGSEFVRLNQPLVRPVAKLAAPPGWLTSADRRVDPSPA
jgi:Icc-related predicted phosphoesterase